jgi:glycerophosphoryl diester phosphodiesterase
MKRRRIIVAVALLAVICLYLANASWLASPPGARPVLLAHRGVHQRYSRRGLSPDTCTAARIERPTHPYLENTIDSIAAAFDHGADIVELDVHPTTDEHFVVFHDWRLECRTDGRGVTREQTLAYLKSLDVGHGYTADGGRTYPFRGSGVGKMPTLTEVLDRFPDRRLLINIKSDDPVEADLLAARLRARPGRQRRRLAVYGGRRPTERLLRLLPDLRGFTRSSLRSCLSRYVALGWSGRVPGACRDTLLLVPSNVAPYLWGWPARFVERMASHGTEVLAVGPYGGSLAGIDDVASLRRIREYPGVGVWTDRIELIGPAWRGAISTSRRSEAPPATTGVLTAGWGSWTSGR